ncbi:MAG: prenyltransferase/squalene oxidase repeat-containing protein [Pirellulales bacterium]
MSKALQAPLHMGLLILAISVPSWATAQTTPKQNSLSANVAASKSKIVQQALNYLKKSGQADDGTFSLQAGPGVTALVLTAMLRNGVDINDPSLTKGLKALEGYVKPDGGVYGNGRLKNYETCVSILAFSEANKLAGDGRYNKLLGNAKKFLTSMQYGEAQGENSDNLDYGGAGYAGKGRPDLSNTTYLVEALRAVEAGADDPAIARALVFISRCQNLSSEFNQTELSGKVNDGGFYYKIPTQRELESGDRGAPEGGLRSYGSMTYSGLKSMIYAGLKPDDIRVKAATQWIAKHYSLKDNPGMGNAGLFYYYHTFGAALGATGLNELTDPQGTKHKWREELIMQLESTQSADGSWENSNRQWFENDKNLCTAFALLALAY